MENKYQHYVPQFYLRNFSNNGKSVGSYIFSQHKYIPHASIKSVCGRDYLYGEDLRIEKWFQNLESIWAKIINKIISTGKMVLEADEWTYLWMFFYLSDVRTAYTADTYIDASKQEIKALLLMSSEYNNLEICDELIEDLPITVNKPNLIYLQNMVKIIDVMSDLSIVLLHNTSNRQFVTSDCPVVKYNQLFIARDYIRPYGYGHVGMQCFLPISPKHCLVLYDGVAYECKKETDLVIQINAPDQIVELNKLFVENSRQALYFNNTEHEWVIKRIAAKKPDTSKKFNNMMFGNMKQGFLIRHSVDCVYKNVKLPQFTINPELLRVPFPLHAAGPLRHPMTKD